MTLAPSYSWEFPLPRTHTGMLQGNGTLGAMIWGENNVLKITLNRADFWDHRGGARWTEKMTFSAIRGLLENNDEPGLRALFEAQTIPPGQPRRPSVLPLGRLELVFDPGLTLRHGTLDLETGEAVVQLMDGDNQTHEVACHLSMYEPLLHLRLPDTIRFPDIRRVSAWEYVGQHLASIGFEPPQMLADSALEGWVQTRPADPPLCLGYRKAGAELWVTVVYGADQQEAQNEAERQLDAAITLGADALQSQSRLWWSEYWKAVPQITIPHPDLSFLYHYGMYKFAGLTAPGGVPATLQGPWVEEYQMPPWSSDYHFNINVQMCYEPAFRGNHLEHLRPLFDLVWSWRDTLRHNAKLFLGIDDGLMLPHAVDDRCTIMAGFWSGTIDHGCTAWVAKMMYDYWRYGGDSDFLRTRTYPFLVGAMRVYEEMLERRGDTFSLPVSVSPEYRGSALNAWGVNASFQLACIQWLCEALITASDALGEPTRPIWREIQEKLPRACVEGPPGKERIVLWQNTPLEESHRHHSHLAGITPFDVIDIDDPTWKPIVERSFAEWVGRGMGRWSGWCVPWAAMLHTRVGNPDMAEMLLEVWQKVFTNEGHGTLHDCQFPGFTLIGAGATAAKPKTHEIMQMDAGMGATTAILDLLLHTRRGVCYLFAGAPKHWETVGFAGIRTEGAFLVSARREHGHVQSVTVVAERGGPFRLASPWPDGATVVQNGQQTFLDGAVLFLDTVAGETITILPAQPLDR